MMMLLSRFIQCVLPAMLAAFLLVTGTSAYAQSGSYRNTQDLEKRVDYILQKITQNQIKEAEAEADRLVKDYPDFRLGQLIKGDLILMRTKPVAPFTGGGRYSQKEKEGLRTEAIARLQASRSKIPDNYIPENLLLVPSHIPYIIVIDTSKSRLYVLQQSIGGNFKVISSYYMSIGKAGDNKQKEGDNRTPIGIYQVTSFIPQNRLPDYYGTGAFPLNYPNAWDKRNRRDGHGIWIHGSPSSTWSRPPLASEGCVVLPNVDFTALKPFVSTGKTPVIIAQKINWLPKDQLIKQRQQFLETLNQWRADFQSRNMDRYLSHYSKQFSADGQHYASWSEQKRKINASKSWVTLNISNVSLFKDPGKEGIMFVQFDQDYKSSNLNNQMRKEQYWIYENGQWKIIYEGAAP